VRTMSKPRACSAPRCSSQKAWSWLPASP
jgi:hypothetical protein